MEYYVSMLICRFVSLQVQVACVKSYHARLKVERDVTLQAMRSDTNRQINMQT